MKEFDVYVGLDVGKSFHHIYAMNRACEVLADYQIIQHEQRLLDAFTELTGYGSVLVTVDQPANIGSLSISCARRAGCEVAYLPGRSMRYAAGILPGEAKTDARDAGVICMVSRSMPDSLRPVRDPSQLRADLESVLSYDNDCRLDLNRAICRLRADLVEAHPAFELTLGDSLTSNTVLKMLAEFGGPWQILDAGETRIRRWIKKQRYVSSKLVNRVLEAASLMIERPMAARIREELSIPVRARCILELRESRDRCEKLLYELLEGDPTYEILTSMPGMGIRSAATFIATVDISRFKDADHLSVYAGLAPRTRRSGTSIKGDYASRIGNKALKDAMYQSAFSSLKCDPLSRQYYDKKRAEGKSHKAALICLAHRRIKILYAMVRDMTLYQVAA